MSYNYESIVRRVKFAREAGAVRRLHVHRIIGEHDIAQHTFNALCLLRALFPNARRNLIWAVLSHDKPERLTGDIPAPAKWVGGWFDPCEYKSMEGEILEGTGFNWNELTGQEKVILEFVDACEFYMTCLDQEALGNTTLQRPKALMFKYIEQYLENWPDECRRFWHKLKMDSWNMCKEIGE